MDPQGAPCASTELPLGGCVVRQVWFWGPVRLKLDRDGFSADVDLERVTVCSSGGDTGVEIDTAQDPRSVARLTELWSRRVVRATASSDGSLSIEFETGTRLEIAPRDDVEAWEYSDSGDSHLLSLPGGGLSWWGNPIPGVERVAAQGTD